MVTLTIFTNGLLWYTLVYVPHVYYMCDTYVTHVVFLVNLIYLKYMCRTPVLNIFHTCNTDV